MANYKEEAVSGSKWVRANKVTVTNPYNGLPRVTFAEEEITVLSDGRTHTALAAGITEEFSDPSTTFNLINPQTNEVIGTASYQDIYVILHSLYISLATKRDTSA